jgi:hypothetical protein
MACQPNQPGSIVTASRETLSAGKVTLVCSLESGCYKRLSFCSESYAIFPF